MKNGKFEVGDIVKGFDNFYGVTNMEMTRGRIVSVDKFEYISVEILEHTEKSEIGEVYSGLEPKHFVLFTDVKNTNYTFTVTTDWQTFVEWETMDGEVYKSKCMPCDEFDLKTGVDLAIDRMIEAEEKEQELPKYVRILTKIDGGLDKGDVVKVLTNGESTSAWLYVSCPKKSIYVGNSASDPSKLEGVNFTYVSDTDYEFVNVYE